MSAVDVLHALVERGETLAVAESLTGGLLAATLVDVPGASKAFRGGLVVYATDLKHRLAGVPESLLAERGPLHDQLTSRGGCDGPAPTSHRRRTAGTASEPAPHPAGGLHRGERQPGLSVRDRARAEGGVERTALLHLRGARSAAVRTAPRRQRHAGAGRAGGRRAGT